uniref:Uncharacterized protein n=1 Tax=Micrurus carvalhoi TaxID=3147026 RepID=A0A2H6N1Y0_9SAUR
MGIPCPSWRRMLPRHLWTVVEILLEFLSLRLSLRDFNPGCNWRNWRSGCQRSLWKMVAISFQLLGNIISAWLAQSPAILASLHTMIVQQRQMAAAGQAVEMAAFEKLFL